MAYDTFKQNLDFFHTFLPKFKQISLQSLNLINQAEL